MATPPPIVQVAQLAKEGGARNPLSLIHLLEMCTGEEARGVGRLIASDWAV